MAIDVLKEMKTLANKIDQEHLQNNLDYGMYAFLISWGVQLLLLDAIERRTE